MQTNPGNDVSPGPQAPLVPALNAQEFEDFIYLISHDVRASVRALIELPQWIAEDLEEAGVPVQGSLATSIDLMNRHTGRLDRMLVDLLTFSRIGRMQNTHINNLNAVLDEVLEEAQLPPEFVVTRDIECAQIEMGERDILTMMNALLQNTVRHHHKKKGRIIVSSSVEGDETVIAVVDDGPGIEEEFRERVFGAMQTLRPRDEVEGSGMGLAMVRKIAAINGGTARVMSSPYGAGTMVEVRLTRRKADT